MQVDLQFSIILLLTGFVFFADSEDREAGLVPLGILSCECVCVSVCVSVCMCLLPASVRVPESSPSCGV